jgi:hypothetical protein
MTDAQANRIATLLLGAALTGATFYILKTPSRRRAAWQLARTAAAAAGPWLMQEMRTAWAQSAPSSNPSHLASARGGDMMTG